MSAEKVELPTSTEFRDSRKPRDRGERPHHRQEAASNGARRLAGYSSSGHPRYKSASGYSALSPFRRDHVRRGNRWGTPHSYTYDNVIARARTTPHTWLQPAGEGVRSNEHPRMLDTNLPYWPQLGMAPDLQSRAIDVQPPSRSSTSSGAHSPSDPYGLGMAPDLRVPLDIHPPSPPTTSYGVHSPSDPYEHDDRGSSFKRTLSTVALYLTREIPRRIYISFLLRLPAFYFSRVARIFEEADLTLSEIKSKVFDIEPPNSRPINSFPPDTMAMPPAYGHLKMTWEAFIDSLVREWKTFNIISVLLLSAILTILQISAAAADVVTRYTALSSLVCALVSLLYGCVYIIRFGTMRKAYKATEWALECRKSTTAIFWNVWVMLAMPAVWLSWTSTHEIDRGPLSAEVLLAVRIAVTALLGLGMLYGTLILLTFSRYGDDMDKAWKERTKTWRLH
ncbi:hypothetical protein BKA70DRAFT_1479938 [Coprinopsis sp. MPI-PUGE-AT-0042]|nr:hypothetical protein BKA70DRAFT_1479938 [Coprinopsis sp. MPI-PUGE-AT-0042]